MRIQDRKLGLWKEQSCCPAKPAHISDTLLYLTRVDGMQCDAEACAGALGQMIQLREGMMGEHVDTIPAWLMHWRVRSMLSLHRSAVARNAADARNA